MIRVKLFGVFLVTLLMGCSPTSEVDPATDRAVEDGKLDFAGDGGVWADAELPAGVTNYAASDGPISASVTITRDAEGSEEHVLFVSYREPYESRFLLCREFPRHSDIDFVFVLDSEDGATSVTRSARPFCSRSFGDNGGNLNSATFVATQADDPELWDTLFPPQADGSRWYALQIAVSNADGQWDSRFGQNYRLVLQQQY